MGHLLRRAAVRLARRVLAQLDPPLRGDPANGVAIADYSPVALHATSRSLCLFNSMTASRRPSVGTSGGSRRGQRADDAHPATSNEPCSASSRRRDPQPRRSRAAPGGAGSQHRRRCRRGAASHGRRPTARGRQARPPRPTPPAGQVGSSDLRRPASPEPPVRVPSRPSPRAAARSTPGSPRRAPRRSPSSPAADEANARAIELRRMRAVGIRSAPRSATPTLAEAAESLLARKRVSGKRGPLSPNGIKHWEDSTRPWREGPYASLPLDLLERRRIEDAVLARAAAHPTSARRSCTRSRRRCSTRRRAGTVSTRRCSRSSRLPPAPRGTGAERRPA